GTGHDGASELVPADGWRAAVMIHSPTGKALAHAGLNDRENGERDVVSRGRAADLVGDDLERRLRVRKPQDGAPEVLPMGGEDPAGAQYNVAGERFAHRDLAGELGSAIDVDW